MLELFGSDLDFRFDYQGRCGRDRNLVLCCSQNEMRELVDSCLNELEQHWTDIDNSYLDDWAVDLYQAIIRAAGRGAIDSMGKHDLVFVIEVEQDTVEELQAQSFEVD